MFSDLIENAAVVMADKTGWPFSRTTAYLEKLIFTCNVDVFYMLSTIIDGEFEILPPVRIRRSKKKGFCRDLWKAPAHIREAKILGMSQKEYEEFYFPNNKFCHGQFTEEYRTMKSLRDRYLPLFFLGDKRHYSRLHGYGIWFAGKKDLYYGILKKHTKREKNWKRELKEYLLSEKIHVLKIH